MEIRRVRPEEYEEAGRVTALAYREHGPSTGADEKLRGHDDDDDVAGWEEYFLRLADVASRDVQAPVLVAIENGRILGSLTLELEERISMSHGPLSPGHAHVRMLGVDPAARGRGVGRALMDAAIEISKAQGKTMLTLNTTQQMTGAQRLYESMGFTREPDEVMPDGFVLLAYSLPLS
jgi:ribosomal protein S18 acetylase RimI-like enzyme